MKLEVVSATLDHKHIVSNLAQLYVHDFMDLGGKEAMDEHGLFPRHWLDKWWAETARYPFLIRADDNWAGFALVRDLAQSTAARASLIEMSEFFVVRGYRRNGVGAMVARELFSLFPGKWQVRVLRANVPAQPFWRGVISSYTGGAFEERQSNDEEWRGLVFTFDSQNQTPNA
ncbi:MAG: GNAT family N-acetyltransferase [Chloroflexi bacterium]|nr:GNAT family N-acetyltransferase [Chloroflexota bacterium]